MGLKEIVKTIGRAVKRGIVNGVKKSIEWGTEKVEKIKRFFNPPKPQPPQSGTFIPTEEQKKKAKSAAQKIKETFPNGTESLEHKTPEQRRETVESLIQNISRDRGLGNIKVEFKSLDCNGAYRPASDTLLINDDLLQCEDPNIWKRLMFTACHEIEHRHQFAAMNAMKNHKPFEQYGYSVERIKDFAENWGEKGENYIDWEEDVYGYYYQPLEVDARGFAELVEEEYERLISNNSNNF